MKHPNSASERSQTATSTAVVTPETSAAPTTLVQQPVQQPVQPPPWFVTRDEQIRLKALELAVQTTSSPNKVELARSYMRFLKPEADIVCDD